MLVRKSLLFGTLLAFAACAANAESLDPTFSSNGMEGGSSGQVGLNIRLVALLGDQNGDVIEVLEQPQIGSCTEVVCIGIARYTSAGDFIVGTVKVGGLLTVSAAQLDNDGRIVVVGQTVDGEFGVFRFKRDLSDDTSFSGDGAATVLFDFSQSIPYALAIDRSNNVVVVGEVRVSSQDYNFGVARFQENGSLSLTKSIAFDLGATNKFDKAEAVAIGADGKIVVVGSAFDSELSLYRVALARLNKNGTADTSFCTGCSTNPYPSINSGRAIYYFGNDDGHWDFAHAVDTVNDGGFMIAGHTNNQAGTSNRGAIARFDLNGNYVNEYLESGTDGHTAFNAVRVVRSAPLRALVGGYTGSTGNQVMFVEAFDAGVNPIANYGSCLSSNVGVCFHVGTYPPNYQADFRALNIDGQGRPLAAGDGLPQAGNETYVVAARITNETGPLPDSIFHSGFQ